MGGNNKFIMKFPDIVGDAKLNKISEKAQRANFGNFRVMPLSFFKRVLSLVVVICMVMTTRMNTIVSYAHDNEATSLISSIALDDSLAIQQINVGDSFDAITFPSTLEATLDTYEEITVEVIEEEIPEEEIPEEEIPVEEAPVEEIPAEETPAEEEIPVVEEEPVVEDEPIVEEEPVVEEPVVEEAPVVEETQPVVEAPVVEAPVVEAAPAPVVEEAPSVVEEIIDGALNIIFPAITAHAEELEEVEPAEEFVETEEVEEIKTTLKKETVKTSTKITLENVQWTLDEEKSSAPEFDSSVAGNTFVYVASVEAAYGISAELPTITVIVVEPEEEDVAFEAQTVVDGIVITVKADPGVFPEESRLSVRRATVEEAEAAEEAVEETEEAPLVETYSFDISILNEAGEEIQPDNSKGKVTVSFALEEAANEDLNTEVYHMDEQVDGSFEAEKLESTSVADTVTAETTGFSVYTVAITGGTVTFENDGYPYGKNMGSTPTLSIRVTNANAVYKWQSSTNKTSWNDIAGATSQDYSFTPTSGTWYRCVVNGAESKSVQMVKPGQPGQDGRQWTKLKSNLQWYVSNGTMAYSVNGNEFDVTGLYIKNGTKYMLQTVYGSSGWKIDTSASATPPAEGAYNESAQLDDLYVSFSDSDEYAVIFVADLKSGQKALSFGSDTQLGNRTTSGEYSDDAALEAALNSNNTLKQIAMIGARSSEDAKDDDPAFVIAPITKAGLKFWVGGFSSRQHFSFASGSDSIVVDGNTISNVRLKCNGQDSGMTMSWSNVPDGGKVSFQFSVGDVASTGAVESNINYREEQIEDLTPGVAYTIRVNGDNTTYVKTADSNGTISFIGKDNNNVNYDFVGKTLNLTAVVNNVNLSANIAIAGRPIAREADTTGTADHTDATRPSEVGKDAIVSSTNKITLNISLGDTARMSQEYRIYDKEGEPVSGWIAPNSNGTVEFTGLDDGKDYVVRARIPATQNAPASNPTTGVAVKTIGTVDIDAPENTTADYNGNAQTYLALTDMDDVEITYSTDVNSEYTSEVPSFTIPGIYTVYYKATKPGFRSTYGSFQVVINKIEREEELVIPEIKTDTDDNHPSVDLNGYVGEDDTVILDGVNGEISNYIYNVRIIDNVLTYNQRESEREVTGDIVVRVENPIYNDNEVSIPIVLPPAIQVEEPEVKVGEYTGEPQSYPMTTPQDDTTIKYSTTRYGEYTEEVPEFENAGTYTVYYEASRPGKTTRYGSYDITIDKQDREDITGTTAITFPHQATEEGQLDLTAYLETSVELISYKITGDMENYITIEELEDGVLKYTIPEGKYGLNGEIKITVVSDNYEEYEITLPIRTAQPPVITQEETKYYGPVLKKEIEEIKEEQENQEETKVEDTKPDTTASENKNGKVDTELEDKVIKLKEEKKLVDKEEVLTTLSTETKKKLVEKLEEKGGEIVAANLNQFTSTGDDSSANSDGTASASTEEKVPVNEVPVALVMGEGAVIVTMELSDNVKTNAGLADAKSVAKSILTQEQYNMVASGSIVEIKVEAIPLETTTVSYIDKMVIENGATEYAEQLPNLAMGNYIDISMYMRVDDSDWNQITETEQFEIVIVIPEEYRGLAETYYIMRAHEGVSTLLEDLDDDPNTITIATGQFSTYALMFDQTPTLNQLSLNFAENMDVEVNTAATVAPLMAVADHYWLVILLLGAFLLTVSRRVKEEKAI